MNRVLLIFAQLAEAEAVIRRTCAEPVAGETAHIWSEGIVPSCYRFEKGVIAICNVGLHSAQMSVAKHAVHCEEVWNLGLAGSLKEGLPIGEIISIDQVGKYIPIEEESLDPRSQECISFTLPTLLLAGNGSRLVSSDFPIHHTQHRERLASKWDLVDMEGYGIAYASAALGKKCRMWKIISDFASPGGRELIRKHKKALAEKIADVVDSALNSSSE